MDTDWCLTCNKRVEGSSLYCSLQCQYGAGPSNYHRHSASSLAMDQYPLGDEYLEEYEGCGIELEEDFDYDEDDHNVEAVSKTNWAGRGSAGIRAWAAEIPLGAHPDTLDAQSLPSPPSDDTLSVSSSLSSTSSTYRAPNLVRPSRPLPPSLTMSKPERAPTSSPRPILTLQRHLAALSLTHSPSTTRTSAPSEDSLPTPASTHGLPLSGLPGRPFPSISDARASDLAACTQAPSPNPRLPSQKGEDSCLARSRPMPIAPRIISSPRSSRRDDDDFDLSPPWWVTGSMVARHATKTATKPRSSSRKQFLVSEAVRGRKLSRVAA